MTPHLALSHGRPSYRTAVWAGGGALLVALAAALSQQSEVLWTWAWSSNRAFYLFVTLSMFAGGVYLLAVGCLRHGAVGPLGLAWIILAGLLMRIVLLPSSPVMETDSFRYMWDGALTAHGLSPYRHTPQEGKRALARPDGQDALRPIAESAGPWLKYINHPEVRTIYPPVSQAAFVVAYWIKAWNGTAWRAVLLVMDLATLASLLLLLVRLRLPIAWIVVYWWNPLAIREFYCGGHMDVIVFPLMMGALLLAISGRSAWASTCLAGAVAAKLWPLILLPVLLRPILRRPRRLMRALAAFLLTAALLFLPMLLAGSNGVAGTQTYARSWEWNDGLFHLNVLFWEKALPFISVSAGAGPIAARWATVAMLATWIGWLARKPLANPKEFCEACLLATAGLYLLSPTQFPWYYTWMLPLLALRPRWSLLLYTMLLPLYHLYEVQPAWVWVEHVPVWVMLASEWWWHHPRFTNLESKPQEENPAHAQRVSPIAGY